MLVAMDVEVPGKPGFGGRLRRPTPTEALELREDPEVRRWLRAYELDQIEAGIAEASAKTQPPARTRSRR